MRREQFGNDPGRILQIRIHRNDGFAARDFQPGRHRELVAKIAGQLHADIDRIPLALRGDETPARVLAAIVHENDFQWTLVAQGTGADFVQLCE